MFQAKNRRVFRSSTQMDKGLLKGSVRQKVWKSHADGPAFVLGAFGEFGSRCSSVAADNTAQRMTEFMTYHSLAEFLDPDDSFKTAEAAPWRTVVIGSSSIDVRELNRR